MSVSLILFYDKFICIIFLDSTYKQYHMTFVFLCLTSVSMTISTSIHEAAKDIISLFLMTNIPLCGDFQVAQLYRNLSANPGDEGLIPGLRRFPGEGNGNPLWYSCLGNSMDRGAWRATVHEVVKSWT